MGICLVVGFASGWLGRSMSLASRAHVPDSTESERDLSKPAASTSAYGIGSSKESKGPGDPAKARRNLLITRLSSLVWEGKHRQPIFVRVFDHDGLDSAFAGAYDLSPNEVAVLNEAIKAAKNRLDAVAIETAKFQLSADGTRIIVEIPPAVDQGGVIYDQLLQTFSSVLGPDRFQRFSVLSGTPFDTGFDSFGLSNTRYELFESDQKTNAGDSVYKISISTTSPGRQATSYSALPFNQIATFYPVLSHFVPPGFTSHRDSKQ